jgi:streptogramin lyase
MTTPRLYQISQPTTDTRIKWLTTSLVLLALLAMAGCGTGILPSSTTPSPSPTVVTQISGRVFGGQQPISGAVIQLYAVNTSTLQGSSTALIASTIKTASDGTFNITGDYKCPVGALVYITAAGGNAGGGANSAIMQMAGLGLCSNLSSSTFLDMNELTTVATVYSLAPYMVDYAHIGAASSNLTGISNAFLTINSLVNIATGFSPGMSVPSGASIPTTELNTIADIIGSCVNSPTASSACSTLFALALPLGGTPAPATTANAILNMARNPGLNVLSIFNLPGPDAPFQPVLTRAPNDWTVAIKLTGASLNSPYGIAIDATGDAWVTNEAGTSVTEFGPTGSTLSGATGYGNGSLLGPQGITIDPAGNIWIANTGSNSVVKLTSTGQPSTYTTARLVAPIDIAADARGNIWVTDFLGSSVTELNSAGNLVGSGGLTANGTLLRPNAVAIDLSGNVWVSNSGQGTLTKFDKNASLLSSQNGYTDNVLQAPSGVALDNAARAWAPGTGAAELSGFNGSGTSIPSTPTYGVLNKPTGVALDGAGNVWVANGNASGSLSEFVAASGVSVPTSQALGTLNDPVKIAVDGSGNIWTANAGDNSVDIFIGLAMPVVTPQVAQTN